MEFLTLLIVLGLVQLWGSGAPLQEDGWFRSWGKIITGLLGPGPTRLLLIVLPPVAALLFLQALFESLLFGLLSLALFVVVLLYCLGRGDFNVSIQRYLAAWSEGDFEAAYDKALGIGDFSQSDAINDHLSLHDHVRVAIIYDGYQRWFAAVFWFLVLGPCGALGYRLSYLCARSDDMVDADRQLALRFVHYLDWIPARLLAIAFALTGNFVQGFNRCGQRLLDNMPIPELLDQCALAAISSDREQQARPTDWEHFVSFGREEIGAVQGLLNRSVICWLIVVALLALAGA